MPSELAPFWLIHLFVGVLLPVMIYTGCCGLGDNRANPNTAAKDHQG